MTSVYSLRIITHMLPTKPQRIISRGNKVAHRVKRNEFHRDKPRRFAILYFPLKREDGDIGGCRREPKCDLVGPRVRRPPE